VLPAALSSSPLKGAFRRERRRHQGFGNVSISRNLPPPKPNEAVRLEAVACHEALRGLLDTLQP
jgi:hypothetical protein